MVRNPFSSPTSGLSLNDALEIANRHLENARKENDPEKALRLIRNAKSVIKDAERIFTAARVGNQNQDDGIANAYFEHGRVLEELGYHNKAQKSRSKAEKWGYIHTSSQQTGSSRLGNIGSPLRLSLCPPAALSAIPSIAAAIYQGIPESEVELLTRQNHSQDATSKEIEICMLDASKDSAQIPRAIFGQGVAPPVTKYALPEADGRITSASQLAYCLSLLDPLLISEDELDENERDWLQAKLNDPDEQQRLRAMATDVIRAFARDELKKPNVVAEVVSLTAVLDQDDFRRLLQLFVDGIAQSVLLEVHLLDGLAQLIQNASPGFIDADDLIKVLELLGTRLRDIHSQSAQHSYRLALVVSRVLDSMVDNRVEGISHEHLHEPLSEYLQDLQHSSNTSLVYQAAYAWQALQYIPDDEPVLETLLRRTGKLTLGVSGVVSAVKALDLDRFILGLQSIQGGMAGAGNAIEAVKETYSDARALIGSGQRLLESLKESTNFSCKRVWYPALRGLDILVQGGLFAEFEKLVREAPCQYDPAFQCGVCQRLGEIAANTVWNADIRGGAVIFLGDLYKDDVKWGREVSIRQLILSILNQLTDPSKGVIADQAQTLLQELERDGNSEERALHQSCVQDYAGELPLMVGLPQQGSLLLDRVQDKPDIETPLRQLKHIRLKERGEDVYISPRAKAGQTAMGDFDLTSIVQEFLASERKVFLLLGDSGAGKSTFNRALEISLWDKYDKVGGRIPLFIHLPAIDKPELDLIAKQLRILDFTDNQIRELKMHHEFVVICDGYDESQQTRNLYTSNQLNQPGGWRAQMVISCRTEYNGVDYRDCFRPASRNGGGNLKLFQEAVITPFNADQIQDYVDQYVLMRKSSWESKDYQKAFKQIPNLQDLVKNPFLLKLALEVLPLLLDTSSEFTAARITRVGLYDRFVEQWIERGKVRLEEIELSSRDKDDFKILLSSGFKDLSIILLKELATAMYDNQDGNPLVSYSDYRDRKTWKEGFFNDRDGRHLLREAIPLIRNGDQFKFIHKSVLEYGITLSIFDPNEHNEDMEPTSAKTRRGSAASTLSFEAPAIAEEAMIPIEQSLLDSPLGRRTFVRDPSILLFLVERVQEQPVFKDQLLALVERSKTDKSARIAAANAITILVKAGIQFNGADLRRIKIPGADLSYGVFDSAQFDGADLRKVNLRSIWLRNANLDGALMTGAQFCELPFIQEDSSVNCCAFSPDGNIYAVGLAGGDINLYETLGWRRIQPMKGHGGHINDLAFSAVGDQIASGGNDNTVRLWNVESGDCIHTLEGHSDSITSVVYSPNGGRVASGSSDKTIRLWDIESFTCIQTFQGHEEGIIRLEYSRKGDQIASACWDSTVRLWDVKSGSCVCILQGHTNSVHSAVYSPKGDQIASGSWDTTVRLWDVESGNCIHTLRGHSSMINCVTYSQGGDQVASGSWDRTVRLWDTETGKCVHTLEGHDSDIICLAYSPKGDQVASGGHDGTVRLWDVDTGNCIHNLQGHISRVTCFAYSPKGDRIASGSWDDTIRLWDVDSGNYVHKVQGHSDTITCVAYAPNRSQIASGSWDETVRLWDIDSGICVHTLRGHGSMITSIAYSPTGSQVATGSGAQTVLLWDVDTGNCLHTLLGHSSRINSIAYSPEGSQIASGSDDASLRLWDASLGTCIHNLEGHHSEITKIAYSPKGDLIISGSEDTTVRLWDVNTGGCIHTLQGHSMRVVEVMFSPNGDLAASGSFDHTVRLWDVKTGNCVHTLQDHTEYITSVVFSPKGNWLASGSEDNTLRLWDVESGLCIHTLEGHTHFVASIVFSPEGDQVVTGSRDDSVKLWDIDGGQCLATITGFKGSINHLVWEKTLHGQYLVTGSEDRSVRRWQIIKEGDEHKMQLVWSTSHKVLTVNNASFEEVQGLSQLDWLLLAQLKASNQNSRDSATLQSQSPLIQQQQHQQRQTTATSNRKSCSVAIKTISNTIKQRGSKATAGEGDTTKGSLQKRISDVCPVFNRLAEIFETDFDPNPLIGWDSITAVDNFNHDQEAEISSSSLDEDEDEVEEDDEVEECDENSEVDSSDDNTGFRNNTPTAGRMMNKGGGPASKRRKIDPELQKLERLERAVASLAKPRQQALNQLEAIRNDLKNREAVLLAREQELTKTLHEREIAHAAVLRQQSLDHEKMLARRIEEHERRVIELKEEKEEFKAQKEESKAEKEELKKQREALAKRWGAFFRAYNPRDDLRVQEEAVSAGLDGSLIQDRNKSFP
ncbi:hypothetical protein BGZ80_006381 [Entomortierella chlamydospora]|uniref:Arm-like repeat domain-containing protein n=1 Tax=Entomortierella chlamydospora TaxID=101097 RepID=A0A9P6T1U9_9FUNG|nr:hypothetical protein BGZ80_006381 [Entomortierella chlamydospora]